MTFYLPSVHTAFKLGSQSFRPVQRYSACRDSTPILWGRRRVPNCEGFGSRSYRWNLTRQSSWLVKAGETTVSIPTLNLLSLEHGIFKILKLLEWLGRSTQHIRSNSVELP